MLITNNPRWQRKLFDNTNQLNRFKGTRPQLQASYFIKCNPYPRAELIRLTPRPSHRT